MYTSSISVKIFHPSPSSQYQVMQLALYFSLEKQVQKAIKKKSDTVYITMKTKYGSTC